MKVSPSITIYELPVVANHYVEYVHSFMCLEMLHHDLEEMFYNYELLET